MTIFYCLTFETLPTWRARLPYLYPQEQGGPVIPPGTGFPFRRLLRLAGLRWRYSNPPPRGAALNQFGRSSDVASEWNIQKPLLPTVLAMLLASRCLATTPVLMCIYEAVAKQ
jgi:hypothetical protein